MWGVTELGPHPLQRLGLRGPSGWLPFRGMALGSLGMMFLGGRCVDVPGGQEAFPVLSPFQ